MRRWPLVYQILIVNSAIVFGGASVGTAMTRALATQSGTALTALFAVLGLVVSIVANYLLLRVALRPLLLLQTVAELVAAGDLQVRAADPHQAEPALTRLIQTFNAMLDRIEGNNQAIEQSRALTEQLAQQVLSAQEDERRRIARELHDETLQSLATLVIYADAAASAEPYREGAALDRLRDVAERTLTGVRNIISDLRPSLLDDLGLAAAVRWQAQNRLEPAGIRVDVQLKGEGRRLSPSVETALYRVIQEAITNVLKHAQASYVELDLDLSRDVQATVRIEDNGIGFDPVQQTGTRSDGGIGLFGMQERINLIGGELSIDSALGEGTEIRVTVPLAPVVMDNPPATVRQARQLQ